MSARQQQDAAFVWTAIDEGFVLDDPEACQI
jgi:hypothetical protein